MNRLYSYLAGGCLLVGASAFTSGAPVMGDALPEHYCFPKYGAPFHDLDRRPSVTIMYQGTTVTATPFAAVGCQIASSNVPPVATGGSLLTSTPSMPLGSPTSIAISSQSAVRSDMNISSGSIRESQWPAMGSWTSSFVASRNPNLATGSGGVAPTSGASPSIRPSGTSLGAGSSPGPSVVTPPSQAPSAGPGGIVPSNVSSPTRPAAPTSLPTDESQNESNTTLPLPPGAVDALELAQFLKNLGVSIFNASSEQATGTSQSAVLANMSTQENTQHKALTAMLERGGSVDIPPCQYRLPNSTTEMNYLMSAFTSIEVSAFLSLAESVPSDATPAAILLSSIASVAARQNMMLQDMAALNTTLASFDTPISATWAYNLALQYVQPGSCVTELPISVLPTLSIGNRVIEHVRPNDTVTFRWDNAAIAAAARSAKPLYIGWVNQVDIPAYTLLNPAGDGSGTTVVPAQLTGTAFAVLTTQPGLTEADELTEATLAGPVLLDLI